LGSLLAVSRAIDAVTHFVGYQVRWLILAAVLVSATNAVIRKTFDTSSNAWLELQWLLFGAVFMLAAAYTLQKGSHVRIDVVSGRLSKRNRDVIDAVCHVVMLMPLSLILIWLSIPFAWDSLVSGEQSSNAGGLIVWPSKALVLAGFVLLFLQAVSELIKRIAVISGHLPDAASREEHDEGAAAVLTDRGSDK
jgi:TRAP-type mannitol/chloroaromatic compound transport system permease small subunit